MMCVEWWTYEIGSFLAGTVAGPVVVLKQLQEVKLILHLTVVSLPGLISEVELGAQSVVYQLANIAYMVTSLM